MSSKYPILPPNQIINALSKVGFEKISQKGSHAKYKNLKTQKIYIIPMHKEIAKGTLKSILEQADIELETFLNLLLRIDFLLEYNSSNKKNILRKFECEAI